MHIAIKMLSPILKNKRSSGFTLVELIVSISILGVLATIAIPAYDRYVEKSRLLEAHAFFLTYYKKMKQLPQFALLPAAGYFDPETFIALLLSNNPAKREEISEALEHFPKNVAGAKYQYFMSKDANPFSVLIFFDRPAAYPAGMANTYISCDCNLTTDVCSPGFIAPSLTDHKHLSLIKGICRTIH